MEDIDDAKPSPSSQSCHQHFSSPTSVTNIDVAGRSWTHEMIRPIINPHSSVWPIRFTIKLGSFHGFNHHNSDKSYGFQYNVPPIQYQKNDSSLDHKLLFVIRSAEQNTKSTKISWYVTLTLNEFKYLIWCLTFVMVSLSLFRL